MLYVYGYKFLHCFSSGLAEYGATRQEYELHLNTILLAKCFACRLWENSRFVTRQLEKIGPALSAALVSSKITSFSALENITPRDIELVSYSNYAVQCVLGKQFLPAQIQRENKLYESSK